MTNKTHYIIVSGEGWYETENQFVMEFPSDTTLEVAMAQLQDIKSGEYDETELFLYKAELIKYL